MFVHGNYVFGRLKQNLAVDQHVVIGRTNSALDGLDGVVLGKTFDDICDCYIVYLREPYNGQKAINLTEACICPL